jgi:hypothetical protein
MSENKLRKRKRKLPCDSISYTTGNIDLNINRFNQAFGTSEGSGAEGSALSEAKRYVRRYYIRPQNIFCSNKAEILKALIELDDANCSIYTLNNLGDDKDVAKLMNSDIIYYYDDGILYDKNRVKVMDYDLSIKKEEERKHFDNVDKAPDREFKAEYEDRMTDATELEESLVAAFSDCDYDVIDADYTTEGEIIVSLNHNVHDIEEAANELITCLETHGMHIVDWNTNGTNVFIFELSPANEFDLNFDDINVFGEKLNEAKEHCCSICGEPIEGNGHHTDSGVVCDGCELHFAIGG